MIGSQQHVVRACGVTDLHERGGLARLGDDDLAAVGDVRGLENGELVRHGLELGGILVREHAMTPGGASAAPASR